MNAIGTRPDIDAAKKLLGEGFKRQRPLLIKRGEAVNTEVKKFFGQPLEP